MKSDNPGDLRPQQQPQCDAVLLEKFTFPGETSANEVHIRVAKGLATDSIQEARFLNALRAGFTPDGGINQAIGSNSGTTAMSHFVQPIGDCLSGRDELGYPGIMDALKQSAETMRRGGRVGYDFSRLRPAGSVVHGTNCRASGPVSYMQVFDRVGETFESTGARRCAQMGVLRVDHPDVQAFCDSKKVPDLRMMGLAPTEAKFLEALIATNKDFGHSLRGFAKLKNFNISVAVTNEFMEAVEADGDFELVHQAHPGTVNSVKKVCSNLGERYVYQTVKARSLWEQIIRNAYGGEEIGVVFIDQVNADNNLRYCEQIFSVNPCIEQPLPPYGAADLGSIDLSRFVNSPFSPDASFNWGDFAKLVGQGIELLDRVLDVTVWPLPEQQIEAHNKRRIGLGFFALGDAMAMMNIRYDSKEAADFAGQVAEVMRDSAYAASIELAKLHGAFPYLVVEKYLESGTFASRLPQHLQDGIRQYGIRNSHCLSIAPTEAVALAFADNASCGIEPIVALRQTREIVTKDGSLQGNHLDNAAYRWFQREFGVDANPTMFVTAMSISVDNHISVVRAVAPFIDSAISKTVNVPVQCSYSEFSLAYTRAWKAGMKGITTYRPDFQGCSVG